MKISSKGCTILSVIWLLVSLVWFLWIRNIPIGIVWLAAGMIELAFALVNHNKEKNK